MDYYYNKKLAYQYIKASQQQISLIFREPANWNTELVGANEHKSLIICWLLTELLDKEMLNSEPIHINKIIEENKRKAELQQFKEAKEKERSRRDEIPSGVYPIFDEAYERVVKLHELDLSKVNVNMFGALSNSVVNDGCGLFRGRLILPYEHLSRFQNDLID